MAEMDDMDDSKGSENIISVVLAMGNDLKLVLLFTIVTLAFIYVPVINDTIIRSALGLVMILFIPGYALIAALFPGKNDIDGIERAALSFGLSIAVVPLIGLALNFTPWGIRLDPIVVCLTIFTIICVLAASWRRQRLPAEGRFSVDFKKVYMGAKADMFADKTGLDKALTIILIVTILASVAMVAYVVTVPKQGEKFTEFYLLGSDGKAYNYPTNFYLGDTKPIIVGITNHEYRNVTYDVVVSLNDSVRTTRLYKERLTLADNQTVEKSINLTPDRTGTDMMMEFQLYEDGNMTAPYRELHLWVNVTGAAAST